MPSEIFRYVREELDAAVPLTYHQFLSTPDRDVSKLDDDIGAFNVKNHFYNSELWVRKHAEHLHYLAFLGHPGPLKDFVERLHRNLEPSVLNSILNYRDPICDYGTALHTLVMWNNSPELAHHLVKHGCNPNILDDYSMSPGRHAILNSFYAPPFRIGCTIDDLIGKPGWRRDIEDFKDVCLYLDQSQYQYQYQEC
mgnify:CR=1 FL=1